MVSPVRCERALLTSIRSLCTPSLWKIWLCCSFYVCFNIFLPWLWSKLMTGTVLCHWASWFLRKITRVYKLSGFLKLLLLSVAQWHERSTLEEPFCSRVQGGCQWSHKHLIRAAAVESATLLKPYKHSSTNKRQLFCSFFQNMAFSAVGGN